MLPIKAQKALLVALLFLGLSPELAAAPSAPKGYQLSPLESYLIETFAEEQVRTFISTGNSTLFNNPKVFNIRSQQFAAEFKASPRNFQKKYIDQFVILNAVINEANSSHRQFKTIVTSPYMEISYQASNDADQKRLDGVVLGNRNGFYCKVSTIEAPVVKLTECLPIGQYKAMKMRQIEAGIKRFLSGRSDDDPNMPTYAMLAYTAVVSAKLLPKDSVCRETISEELTYTSAEMRLCNQEVTRLWENAGVNPKFDETMDSVQDQFQRNGIDIKLLSQAAGSLD